MTRQPNWDIDRERGEKAEDLFRALRNGILVGTTEVKRDDRAAETGNVYIETECQRFDGWHPSGLNDPDLKATAWAIVCWPVIVALPVWILRQVIEGAQPAACAVGSHPTRGVVVRLSEFLPRAIAVANTPIDHKDAA